MTQHSIVQKSEKIVKEWIEYAKKEYGWKEELFELFEEPMIELCTSAATQSVKDFEKENAELNNRNQELLESCEGATMMYKQLTKAKDLLLRFIELKNKPCAVGHSVNMLLYENICTEAKQFLNSEVGK